MQTVRLKANFRLFVCHPLFNRLNPFCFRSAKSHDDKNSRSPIIRRKPRKSKTPPLQERATASGVRAGMSHEPVDSPLHTHTYTLHTRLK